MVKKRQQPTGKKGSGGRPHKQTQERRIEPSFTGRLKFRPGFPHALDDQIREARNYRLLLAEQVGQLQALLAELEQLDDPDAQMSQEENALKAFLWETYQDHKHRDHILATFLGIRRKRLLERLQASQVAIELARDFLAPDHRILQELQQAIEQARQPQEMPKQDEEGPQPLERQVNHRHIYGDAEHTRMQLAQFDELVKQVRSTITSGIGWFEEFYVSKQRLSTAARAYMRKGEDVPEDVAMFEDVLYGPYLKYRWREEGSKRPPFTRCSWDSSPTRSAAPPPTTTTRTPSSIHSGPSSKRTFAPNPGASGRAHYKLL